MDYFKVIESRESCRTYMNKPVKRELIDRCLEAARIAPSACNCQPWRYVVVDNPFTVKKLYPLLQIPGSPINKYVDQVPVFVAVIEKPIDLSVKLGAACSRANFSELDIGLSVAQFCLTATALGLGNCIIGCLQEDSVRELLGVPDGYRIRLVLALGYAASGDVRPKARVEIDQMSSYNSFSNKMK